MKRLGMGFLGLILVWALIGWSQCVDLKTPYVADAVPATFKLCVQIPGVTCTNTPSVPGGSVDTVRCSVQEGTSGVITVTLIHSATFSCSVLLEASIPAGWPVFTPVSKTVPGNTPVSAQYSFTVPRGTAGRTIELKFKASALGCFGELVLSVVLNVGGKPDEPQLLGPFTGTTDENGKFTVSIPNLPNNVRVGGTLTECTVRVLARTTFTLYVAARPMTFGTTGIAWAAYTLPPIAQQAAPVDYVLVSVPGYPQVRATPVRVLPVIVGGTTYTMVDLGTISFPSPTCPRDGAKDGITGTTAADGKFTVSVGSGTTVSGRLMDCTVKPSKPLANQSLSVKPVFSGGELDKLTFSVPGYADVTVTQAVTVFHMGSQVMINIGDVCLLPPPKVEDLPCPRGCSPGLPTEIPEFKDTRRLDLEIPCCCNCSVTRIEGPDIVQLGYDRTASYRLFLGVVCEGGEGGSSEMGYPRSTEGVTWAVSSPASLTTMNKVAVVHVPPPTKAQERIEVTLTATWWGAGICFGKGGRTYLACWLSCSASKNLLLTSDCCDLEAEIARLEAEFPAREAEAATLEADLDLLRASVSEGRPDLEAEGRRLKESIAALRRKLDDAVSELAAAEGEAARAESLYQNAAAAAQVAFGVEEATLAALDKAWKEYRKAGFSVGARCLVYLDWYGIGPAPLSSADRWRTDVQRRFIRDILGLDYDPDTSLLAAAQKACVDSAFVIAAKGLVELGKIINTVISWGVAFAKGTLEASIEAAAEKVVSDAVESGARAVLGDKYEKELTRSLDPKKEDDVRKTIGVFLSIIRQLEWAWRDARDKSTAASMVQGDARAAWDRAKEKVKALKGKVERLQQALEAEQARLEALEKGVEEWRAKTAEKLRNQESAAKQARADLDSLARHLNELREEYNRQCPKGKQ